MLENKLGITNQAELAKQEEIITKQRAYELFDLKLLDQIEVGTFKGLSKIHEYLFQDIYDFAGKIRTVNIAKGSFAFANTMYLEKTLKEVSAMPQSNFDEIINKYIEMNVAHPFREGNGRSTRIWLDMILKKELSQVIDWNNVDKEDYLYAMQLSPYKKEPIKKLLHNALTDKTSDREIFMKGIDASYYYEGYYEYNYKDLDVKKTKHKELER